MQLPSLILRPNTDRRLKAGHLWIFSNEVDISRTPLVNFQPGQQAIVLNSQEKVLGVATINPNTLICGRLVSDDANIVLDKSLLIHRINIALSLRQRLFNQPYYRLIYGDSDLLPGLVVDRFDDIFVVQISSIGMEVIKEAIVEALVKVFHPKGILFKNSGSVRELEGLPDYIEVAHGEVPQKVIVEENGARFWAPVHEGQKTGWFYDHRIARQKMHSHVQGKRVLDVFSYIGGWGIQALMAGAEQLISIDSSEFAMNILTENAELNGVADKAQNLLGDAAEQMKNLIETKEKFDVVILDPPAFIKRRKDFKAGERAYRKFNELAMRLVTRDGLLITSSCSMHMQRETLVDVVRGATRHIDRFSQIIDQSSQGPDHPIHPAIPETEYLKSLFVRVLRL